jgi:hypothetical protein
LNFQVCNLPEKSIFFFAAYEFRTIQKPVR